MDNLSSGKNCRIDAHSVTVMFFIMFFAYALFFYPSYTLGAEKKARKPAPKEVVKKDIVISDANIQSSLKRAEELLKKGDIEGSLPIYTKIYEFTKEAITTVSHIQKQYERFINEPETSQADKEEFFIKLNRIKQLIPRYKAIKDTCGYNLGFIYGKKNEPEKARIFLTELMETLPFSRNKDSLWMRAKTLLLEIYALEGEF
ncbi:MAG: hypothetical protein N2745_09545 [Syntrophorhabdaceae bacterium]|nr:hypothetical protein [Syntrophorhabdaceae bacterium]